MPDATATTPTRPARVKRASATPTFIEEWKPPTCSRCGVEMTWRDALYGGKAREATDDTPAVGPTCKRCNRQAQRAIIKGVFSAAVRVVEGKRGKRLVPIVNRATLRQRPNRHPNPKRPEPSQRPSRAMRRQAAREATRQVA